MPELLQWPVLLLVEDDLLVRLTLVEALSGDGFAVLEAGDASAALHLVCSRSEIVAMLTDLDLPGESDGFALAQAARRVRPGLPVVYASGRCGALEPGRLVAGARFLAKPFTPSLAAETLRHLIGGRP